MATDDKSAAPSGDAITTTATETKTIEPAGALKSETAPFDLKGLANIEAPKLAAENTAPLAAEPLPPAAPIAYANLRRHAPLAAAIAIGILGGALGSFGLFWPSEPTEVAEAAPMPTDIDETRALHSTLAQLRTELAALKTSVDTSAKGTNGQLAKLAERIERAQAEPTTKITKAVESLERLEKRVDALTAREATGSVPPQQPQPQQTAANAATQLPTTVVSGWVVRDVYRGAAIVQGRGFGMIEVEAGDTIPGIGRVESIKRQNGRWIVVTTRGLITSAR